MSYLIGEILLRLVKPALALALGLVIYGVILAVTQEPASASLLLLCWLSAAAFVLLVQEGPI